MVRRAQEAPARVVASGTATEMRLLIGAEHGAPNFAMRRFSMGAGGGMPLHTNSVEHEQYVLSGRAEIRIGDGSYRVEPGTVLFIPAGVPHSYQVMEAPFEFLCLVPNAEDRVSILPDAPGGRPPKQARRS